MLDLLEAQDFFPKFYWEDRSGVSIAACGAVKEWNELPETNERVYGGMSFCHNSALWQEFPETYFFLPAFELREEAGKIQRINRTGIALKDPLVLPTQHQILSTKQTPSYDAWHAQVEEALIHIAKGSLEKVVLARRVELQLDQAVSPWTLLKQLKKTITQNSVTFFCLQISPTAAFLGATPELLYKRHGTTLQSEAVAATTLIPEELFHCEKKQREFFCVTKELQTLFSHLCTEYNATNPSPRRSAQLFHLTQQFSGILKPFYRDSLLLGQLHPTSAIGGYPKKAALKTILSLESCERGWYSGPIGWKDLETAQFCVAIRSVLLRGTSAHLFSGTGIVAGSDPLDEWEELNQKIKPIQDALAATSY